MKKMIVSIAIAAMFLLNVTQQAVIAQENAAPEESAAQGTEAGAGETGSQVGFWLSTTGKLVVALGAIAGLVALATDSDGTASTTSH